MAEARQTPFHSFSFTLIQNKMPRAAMRLSLHEQDMYELHVQKGSVANPSMQFTRLVPDQVAVRFHDALRNAGVFGWEESYGDTRAPGSLLWNLSLVFKEGVFSITSKGGSDTPPGFDDVLEELYRLDFPRPKTVQATVNPQMAGDSLGMDFDQLANFMEGSGLAGFDSAQMAALLSEARTNPQALQNRMRQEFRLMPKDEQEQLLDALAASGMASRAWWERFLRG